MKVIKNLAVMAGFHCENFAMIKKEGEKAQGAIGMEGFLDLRTQQSLGNHGETETVVEIARSLGVPCTHLSRNHPAAAGGGGCMRRSGRRIRFLQRHVDITCHLQKTMC